MYPPGGRSSRCRLPLRGTSEHPARRLLRRNRTLPRGIFGHPTRQRLRRSRTPPRRRRWFPRRGWSPMRCGPGNSAAHPGQCPCPLERNWPIEWRKGASVRPSERDRPTGPTPRPGRRRAGRRSKASPAGARAERKRPSRWYLMPQPGRRSAGWRSPPRGTSGHPARRRLRRNRTPPRRRRWFPRRGWPPMRCGPGNSPAYPAQCPCPLEKNWPIEWRWSEPVRPPERGRLSSPEPRPGRNRAGRRSKVPPAAAGAERKHPCRRYPRPPPGRRSAGRRSPPRGTSGHPARQWLRRSRTPPRRRRWFPHRGWPPMQCGPGSSPAHPAQCPGPLEKNWPIEWRWSEPVRPPERGGPPGPALRPGRNRPGMTSGGQPAAAGAERKHPSRRHPRLLLGRGRAGRRSKAPPAGVRAARKRPRRRHQKSLPGRRSAGRHSPPRGISGHPARRQFRRSRTPPRRRRGFPRRDWFLT